MFLLANFVTSFRFFPENILTEKKQIFEDLFLNFSIVPHFLLYWTGHLKKLVS